MTEDLFGRKFDNGKVPVHSGFINRFPLAIAAIATVSEYGFLKYGSWDGWMRVPNAIERYTNAKARHMLAQSEDGGDYDDESGLAHAAMEAWNAVARLELLLRAKKIEVRSNAHGKGQAE